MNLLQSFANLSRTKLSQRFIQLIFKPKFRISNNVYSQNFQQLKLQQVIETEDQNQMIATEQQTQALYLTFQKQKLGYNVIRNYLVPLRPLASQQFQNYILRSNSELSVLNQKQLRHKLKNLSEDEKNMVESLKEKAKKVAEKKQRIYDKVLFDKILKYPSYHDMLLKIQHQSLTELKNLTYSYKLPKLEPHMTFNKLKRIHPLIRYNIWKIYEDIHNEKTQKETKFNKISSHLPILYFNHPYEVYLTMTYRQQKKKLKKSEYYCTQQQTQTQYLDEKWDNLDKFKKERTRSEITKLLNQYENKFLKCSEKSGLPIKQIQKLYKNQYCLQNEMYCMKIFKHFALKSQLKE